MHLTASIFPVWHWLSLVCQWMQWLPLLLYYAPLQAAAFGVKSVLWVSSHPSPAPLPLPHHQMPLGQPSPSLQPPARLKSSWGGPWTPWEIRLAPEGRRHMKNCGDASFPLYLPPISKLLGVSVAPQQLSEPSQASPLSKVSCETLLTLLRDHTWGPVMPLLQNFFFGIADKNYFALTLEMATYGFALRSSK